MEDQKEYGSDVNGVRYMTLYGIKGLAAYAVHASCLGEHDPWVPKFIYQVRTNDAVYVKTIVRKVRLMSLLNLLPISFRTNFFVILFQIPQPLYIRIYACQYQTHSI